MQAREVLIAYLALCVEEEDWHGVQDAASDLRDNESECDGIKWCLKQQPPPKA